MTSGGNAGFAARSGVYDHFALAAIICLGIYLLIGDFGVRLANTGSDEGLIGYAYYFKYPELFRHDAHMVNWGSVALASALNWLPAVAFKYAGVPPDIFYWLFAFLQNVLLGFAVYRFARVATGTREVAWLAALFTLAFRPHWWNIALFGDVDWMPYAGWLALPFLVYAGAYALEYRLRATALTLLTGALVHPVLGLCAAAMIGAFWMLAALRERNARSLWVKGTVLAAVVAAFTIPLIAAKIAIQEAPLSEVLPVILRNGHTIPWASVDCTYCMPLFTRNLTLTVALTALAVVAVRLPGMHRRVADFLYACIAVSVAAVLVHIAGYLLESVTILRVITFRATVLLLTFAVPLVVALSWRRFLAAGAFGQFVAGYFLLRPSAAAALAVLLVLPGMSPAPGAMRRPASVAAKMCGGLGTVLFAVLVAYHLPVLGPWVDARILATWMDASSMAMLFGDRATSYSVFVIVFLAAVVAWRRLAPLPHAGALSPVPSRLALALAVPVLAYLLAYNHRIGQTATGGESRLYYEVQAWVRASTPREAEFVVAEASVYEGWRNFTRRPLIAPYQVCAIYLCPIPAWEYDRKLAVFYKARGNVSYKELDGEGLLAFSRTFGGDYAVRRRSWGPLVLPVAYENAEYVVYALR